MSSEIQAPKPEDSSSARRESAREGSVSGSEDHSDDSQASGNRDSKKRKRNLKIS